MLKFDQVSKEFKDGNQMIEAVKSTSLTFDKGELIAIVGPSGSGKSTFLTMAGALQTPTHGEIYINDNKISQLSQKQLAKMRMKEIENKLPSEVSGGQKQRVAIAKAIYTQPSIILADEPTASLDTENAMAVMRILKEQSKQRHKTCIIVTHDERLTKFCDKMYHMEDGYLKEK